MLGKLFSVLPEAFKLVDNLFTSDEERGKIKVQMMEVAQRKYEKSIDLEMAQMEADTKLKEKQSEVIVAEASSGDKYTSRMRPTAGYMFLAMAALDYASVLLGSPYQLTPEMREHTWLGIQIVLGGYIGTRGLEKIVKTYKKSKKDV